MSEIAYKDVVAALRAAPLPVTREWKSARFVNAERVERSGRPVIAASLTTDWQQVDAHPGYRLRPYGVHQHTLIVGVIPVESMGLVIELDAVADAT